MRCRVEFFLRQGQRHRDPEDTLAVGPLIASVPTAGPVRLELDVDGPMALAVFDGMGGHTGGRQASIWAATDLVGRVGTADLGPDPERWLADTLVEASRRLADAGAEEPRLAGMGTTVAGLMLSSAGAYAFNVGDSRVLTLRGRYLCQYSVDDTPPDSRRGRILQCLGAGLRHLDPHVRPLPWSTESVVLVCSDGLHGVVSPSAIETALVSPDPIVALWELTEGGADDAGLILVRPSPHRRADLPAEPAAGEGSATTCDSPRHDAVSVPAPATGSVGMFGATETPPSAAQRRWLAGWGRRNGSKDSRR